ncbi:glucosamine-6-phosphate deaminase [[Clostridium] spiroforme]|nr:glucosamine-6-phosphate deaminase [Thomasclavelia spiroformis]MBM6880068.1 glucosamine-6-phosphate deaminase [Thomasclavelia spiroformis]MBM6931101.1 glucosamine-6-phosphate deaminase [Thomasclavelia spiroformis]
MKVIKVKNYEEASQEAAKIFIDQVKTKPDSVLGLATGSTPVRMYEILRQDHKENGTSYKNIKSYNLDEYFGLEHDHPQSYHYFMFKNLFSGIDIDAKNVHVPSGHGDVEANCVEYNKMLDENPIDIQLLGIGSNGHIGFNEPGTSFDSVTHVVQLKQSTIEDNARLFFDGKIEDVPTQAISMGIQNIMNAKKVVLIACGENKQEAVKGLIEGPVTTDLPASVLQNHDDVVVIIDEAAAKLLDKEY